MKDNGVIINDLNAETRRQGRSKTNNVHDVGNLAPKVTEVIEKALAARKNLTKPLPRVLFIGDTNQYPEFIGNVVSIDTRPMCRPPEQSPGGRDRFAGNAESYLDLGDAMADAMLRMMKPR